MIGLLDSKVALITGSGRGIGRAIALRLAQDGADVVINFFRNRKPAEETATTIRELGRRALVVKANVGDLQQLEALFAAVKAEYGGLDILVNNAASGQNLPVMEQRPRGWEWTMNINARSVLFGAQHALPLMKERGGGRIINITSAGSQFVLPDYVVVGSSKAAVEALTRYLAVEFSSEGVIVNAVSPGMVATEAWTRFRRLRADLDAAMTFVQERTPAGRMTTPDDVAGVVSFLCSPAAEMIRGQIITVDGGYLLAQGSGTVFPEGN